MNDTIILYEKCVHGRLEKHNDPAWPTLDDATGEWNPMCPGGKAYKVIDRVTSVIEGWRFDPHGHAYVVEEVSDE